MAITANKLARILGVSPSTISLVYNKRPGVSESTIKLVLEGAAQYGYVHKAKASIVQEVNQTITYVNYIRDGSVVDDTAFFSTVIRGAEATARSLDYNLVITYIYETKELAPQIEALRNSGTSGIILLATEMDESKCSLFTSLGIPIVILDNNLFALHTDSVYINNVYGAYAATSYLISQGHKLIGYLASKSRINNFKEREQGLKRALSNLLGINENSQYRFEVGSSSESAYASMKVYTEEHRKLPTAFFADNDLIAVGCMRALKESGYRIPEDISIIGFDNMPIAELVEPTLTTMHVRKSTLGQLAVQQLDQHINDHQSTALSIAVLSELVVRESVKQLRI